MGKRIDIERGRVGGKREKGGGRKGGVRKGGGGREGGRKRTFNNYYVKRRDTPS